MQDQKQESATLALVRKILFAVLAVGLAGTLTELLLLEHTDGVWQMVPVGLLGGALVALGAHAINGDSRSLVRALQGAMVLLLASGVAGVILHYKGNVEFELERQAGLAGVTLFREAMMGATPALAPGAMIQLGLIGLAYTVRHPVLRVGGRAG